MTTLFVLYESASGYALLEQTESDEIGQFLEEMQSAMADLSRLSKVVKLKAFIPFQSAQEALEGINDISEGVLNEKLKGFLEMNLPTGKKDKKDKKYQLGVLDTKIGSAISEVLFAQTSCSASFRMIRLQPCAAPCCDRRGPALSARAAGAEKCARRAVCDPILRAV